MWAPMVPPAPVTMATRSPRGDSPSTTSAAVAYRPKDGSVAITAAGSISTRTFYGIATQIHHPRVTRGVALMWEQPQHRPHAPQLTLIAHTEAALPLRAQVHCHSAPSLPILFSSVKVSSAVTPLVLLPQCSVPPIALAFSPDFEFIYV